mmetsp:Transcript_2766/g.2575  ORF Transcript_2766/g.2575 Transcript_2766/m.2575 type:complete len:186 (+) Transcript_2766:584-1141(+)
MLKPIIPTSVKSFFEWKSLLKKMSIAIKLITLPFDYRDIFVQAIKSARLSGKLLAHALMLQFPFVNQSISLVGFSLGTQVIYSCLEELKAHGAENIINNVYFLGGAVSIPKYEDWATTLSVARGTITNGFSKFDYILHLYRASMFMIPIGRIPLFEVDNPHKMTKAKEELEERFKKCREGLRIKN